MTDSIVEILLVEDNPSDVELALRALKKNQLANQIHVVRNGAEALDFLCSFDLRCTMLGATRSRS
jgi:CheY-like chemotaxis protein